MTLRAAPRARRRALTLAVLLGGASALAVSGAHAQDAAELEELVVTAQKRSENLQDVPISITAVTSDSLARSQITTLGGLQTLTPNFQVSDNVSVRTVYIRGVGGGGRTVAFDTRTGIYLDGVYIGQPMAADAVLSNLERVEVLRGPQGYLYGQNTVSGAVNLVTRAPVDDFEGRLTAGLGNKDQQRLDGMVNIPLADGKVMVRLGAAYDHRDGFIRNTTLGEKVDDINSRSMRLQVRMQPTDDFTADLSFDYSRQLSHKVNGEALSDTFNSGPPAAPADQPFVIDDNYPEFDYNRNVGGALTLAYDLGAVTLSSISGYRDSARTWNVDLDHSALDLAHFNYDDSYQTLSQEVRLSSNDTEARLRYILGAFFLRTDGENDRRLTYDALGVLFGVPPGSMIRTNPSVKNSSYAVFGAVDYQLTPTLIVNSGLRFNYESKKLTLNQSSDVGPPISNIANVLGFKDELSESSVSPMIGLTFQPTEDQTYYGKYARGVKSGGFNADYLTTQALGGPLRLGKETVDSFELGAKFTAFERRLRVNADVFYARYSDYQVSQFRVVPNSTPPRIELALTNAGEVETYGPEVSVDAALAPGLNVNLQAAWLHAEYKEFKDGGGVGVDYSGNRLEYAPEVTASATVDYTRDLAEGMGAVTSRLTVSYRGDQYSDTSNAEAFHQDAYTLVNARVAWLAPGDQWQVAAYADNLLEEEYQLGTAPDAFTTLFGRYGAPRTYGLEVTWTY